MSSLLRPVGPQRPGVYWARRLLVLVALLLVVGLAWWLFLRPSGGARPAASPGTSPSPSTGPNDSSTASTTSSPTGSSPTTSPSASPSSTLPPCRTSAIEVTVSTDKQRYAAGEQPQFTLGVQNSSAQTCLRDVGQSALELRVTAADGTPVWSSDDCNPGGPSAIRTFGPGDRWVLGVTWSRQESEPGCPAGEPDAPAGDYEVIARNLTELSDPAAFSIR